MVTDELDDSFAAAAARASRALALAKRDLEGIVLARTVAAVTVSVAARTSREACHAADERARAGSKQKLHFPDGMPAADPGVNLTPRVIPSPRA